MLSTVTSACRVLRLTTRCEVLNRAEQPETLASQFGRAKKFL